MRCLAFVECALACLGAGRSSIAEQYRRYEGESIYSSQTITAITTTTVKLTVMCQQNQQHLTIRLGTQDTRAQVRVLDAVGLPEPRFAAATADSSIDPRHLSTAGQYLAVVRSDCRSVRISILVQLASCYYFYLPAIFDTSSSTSTALLFGSRRNSTSLIWSIGFERGSLSSARVQDSAQSQIALSR